MTHLSQKVNTHPSIGFTGVGMVFEGSLDTLFPKLGVPAPFWKYGRKYLSHGDVHINRDWVQGQSSPGINEVLEIFVSNDN